MNKLIKKNIEIDRAISEFRSGRPIIINKDNQVLVMCAAGGRSIIAANLLANEGYKTLNVSDGYSGNGQDPGWKNLGLPSIIDN